MVEGRLELEPEVREIFKLIDDGKNFLLSGGAGSGKTYSLVSVIRQVIAENPTIKVACMTYTNAAVKEIEERVNHKNLNVSTIHDFLWDNIKHFQKELKEAIITLANDENITRIKINDLNPVPDNFFDDLEEKIKYKEFVRIREGIISHDELIIVANYLFQKYPKLNSVVKDKYKFIFLDEYQDTSGMVVETFLTHFKKSKRKNIIGFFGDAMQNIYPDTVGNLDAYDDDVIKKIAKKQNRRNPQLIIDLANKLRTDGITQEPSTDPNAPNMEEGVVKPGTLLFLHSNDNDISKVEKFLEVNYGWDFKNSKDTKELNLTHNLIAGKAGFKSLMLIYDKDHILSFKDRIKNYIKDKGISTDFSENSFGEVINTLQQGKTGPDLKKVSPTNTMQAFIDDNEELFNYAKTLNYSKFSKIYVDKDQLLDDKKQDEDDENKKDSKRDSLIKHLFKIQNNISLYQNKRYNEFLRATDFRYKITSIASKRTLKENIESLIAVGDKTIEEVITDANEKGICIIDDKLNDFKEKKEYLYNRVKDVKFSEFQKLYEYLEGQTPFSTQHKTKGAELDNILVLLDNGGWNNYNFEKMFLGTASESVMDRTQKIFYVCCTRAKENLAVFFHSPSDEVIVKAKDWFGVENVISIE
ncbi:UvrD-helicase domain-containing protein [Salinimicrobium sediminilitoris]|uniref:UvrD-helicase domain-containing protein n=1 Tax=Salinimicrobium sediminilitoris TaxID=2876715 RepID=UPI001E34203F|nr:UvrD-helicase domain-containing protein [Salinimicrobium sediminilitoris]MCC8361105.1 AAA family ATPase [Salinimicrobium sediminilitoris]